MEIECSKFKFKRYEYVAGFIAFDKDSKSVGFDEVARVIDEQAQTIEKQQEKIRQLYIGMSYDLEKIEEIAKQNKTLRRKQNILLGIYERKCVAFDALKEIKGE